MRALRVTQAEPAATVIGTVADLALWAWGRGGSVEVTGESSAIVTLSALIGEGMQ
jgi:hypothetical protein